MREPEPPPRRIARKHIAVGVRWLCHVEPAVGTQVARHGLPPLWARTPGFASLLRIILEQQVSLASANAMYRRLQLRLGRISPLAVAGMGEPGLRELGLTRQKSAYCVALAQQVLDGSLDFSGLSRASDADARSTLLGIKGIGPWSAEIYQLMALRRPDIWPTGDIALLSALTALHELESRPDNVQAARLTAPWAPWRSVGARLLWHGYLRGSLRGR